MVRRISCLNCAKSVPPNDSGRGRRKRYCNKHCATQYKVMQQIKHLVDVDYKKRVAECRVCKQPFNPIYQRHNVCSEACRIMAQRKAHLDNPDKRPNMFQAAVNKEFISDRIIEREANKRAALPVKPVRRRGPDPKTAARKQRHAAIKERIKAERAAVKRILRERSQTPEP